MSGYTKVLGPLKNRFFIDNSEIDLFGREVEIKRASISGLQNINGGHNCQAPTCVEYHGKLHFFGWHLSGVANYYPGRHSIWDGETWEYLTENSLPMVGTHRISFNRTIALVYKDEIHLLGCCLDNSTKNIYHFKYSDDNGWVKIGKMPYDIYGADAIVYRDSIELFGGLNSKTTKKSHYVFDGKWKSNKKTTGLNFLFYKKQIHKFLANMTDTRFYQFDSELNTDNLGDFILMGYNSDESKEFEYINNLALYNIDKITNESRILRRFYMLNVEPIGVLTTPAGELLIIDKSHDEVPYINIKRLTKITIKEDDTYDRLSFELIVSILESKLDSNTVIIYFKDKLCLITKNKIFFLKESYELILK